MNNVYCCSGVKKERMKVKDTDNEYITLKKNPSFLDSIFHITNIDLQNLIIFSCSLALS